MFLSKKWLQQKLKLIPIDFTRPWWYLIIDQKWLVVIISLLIIAGQVLWSIAPFLVAYTLQCASPFGVLGLYILWVLVDAGQVYARQLNAQFQLQCIHSIQQSAHQYLLTVDPQYHIHRSSGMILGKIDRAARGYEDLLDQITFDFIPLSVGMIIMVIVLAKYSISLTCGIAFLFLIMIVGGYYFARYTCKPWENGFIKSDDEFRSTSVENLAQVQLVRATFASDYMSDKLTRNIEQNMRCEGSLWLSYTTASFILNMIYLFSIFCLLSVLVWQIKRDMTSVTSAVSLAIAYVQSTKDLVKITKPLRRYMRGWAAVSDLFDFIPHFGKQGYPVLGQSTISSNYYADITIKAADISFDYETAELFNHHTFDLQCAYTQENKLYGIVGPSGSGKTTLLSILGGQLKPQEGTVTINSINIYAVTDAARRQLIALQGQVATTVRGTIKYNMLFGLPQNHGYDDAYLLEILERVGLLSVISAHNGLQTMLGEGGLNLSGGQRQRLNFAGLYLRAHHYKPRVILIDEPTSSLDELSEAAITEMIVELARDAVTLVIAHRLKTVEKAVGLIDLSLLDQEKDMRVYTPSALQKRSTYYCELLQGKVPFDS
jgi:ABC-type multidrug transport system fused ATPase/permease subunit